MVARAVSPALAAAKCVDGRWSLVDLLQKPGQPHRHSFTPLPHLPRESPDGCPGSGWQCAIAGDKEMSCVSRPDFRFADDAAVVR